MKVKDQKKYLMNCIRDLFPDLRAAELYVERKLMDKYRALVERRKRFMRKAYLNNFDYFVTFTYANEKHTEDTFKKKLRNCLNHYANRYDCIDDRCTGLRRDLYGCGMAPDR